MKNHANKTQPVWFGCSNPHQLIIVSYSRRALHVHGTIMKKKMMWLLQLGYEVVTNAMKVIKNILEFTSHMILIIRVFSKKDQL